MVRSQKNVQTRVNPASGRKKCAIKAAKAAEAAIPHLTKRLAQVKLHRFLCLYSESTPENHWPVTR